MPQKKPKETITTYLTPTIVRAVLAIHERTRKSRSAIVAEMVAEGAMKVARRYLQPTPQDATDNTQKNHEET